jgi:hypothetical protein
MAALQRLAIIRFIRDAPWRSSVLRHHLRKAGAGTCPRSSRDRLPITRPYPAGVYSDLDRMARPELRVHRFAVRSGPPVAPGTPWLFAIARIARL